MAQRIQLRRGTAAEWTAANPVLANGEPGVETDTGKQKFGNGVAAWTVLPYASAGPQGPAGVADDASVADLVTTPGSETATALSATNLTQITAVANDPDGPIAAAIDERAVSTSAFAPALQKIAAGTNDVNLLIVGDSTTAKTAATDQTGTQVDTWGERLPAALAAEYPTHTISTRWYNDGTSTYDAATTIAGSGARTIHLWMGAVPGKETGYPIARASSLLATPAAAGVDLLVIAHGHNENNVTSGGNTATDAKLRDRYVANVEQIRTYTGNAPTVITSQNPAPALAGFSERRADIYRSYAAERGYGFVDVCAAFYADGRSIADVLIQTDGLHPANAGAVVWLNAMMKPLAARNAAAQPLRPSPPAFFEERRNFLVNSNFTDWPTSSTLTSWNQTNLTVSQQAGTAALLETKSYSAKLTKTAAGSSAKLDQSISAQAKLLAGREVTFAVRMHIPAGTPQTAAQISISDGATLLVSDQTKVINDTWFWKIVTIRCRSNMTALTCNIQVDPSATGSLETIYVDRAALVLGRYPADSF
ncbi:GDSL-type esterase/lipase family protein [Arthrobacter sp. SD76]|uniref:hyaluronate lyase N-terminal domain-containing protein n=1 Tax=Arthrobacter sp. SD76 TaxID=3415007 RepID=UPI003C713400